MIVTLPSSCPDGRTLDAESRVWLTRLRAADRDRAVGELHGLLMGAARHEVNRRSRSLPPGSGVDLDDLARQSADDALLAILRKLDDFRGDSRFTTWAYKFALLEAAVKLRRRAWQGREVPLEPESWGMFAGADESPQGQAEHSELFRELRAAVDEELSPHQREVFVALALNEVPIDVLAERLNTTRGALYKTLHDARKKLRARVEI